MVFLAAESLCVPFTLVRFALGMTSVPMLLSTVIATG